jgi:multidrug efflux pump subunit AcrA (membrane-fusion protein)
LANESVDILYLIDRLEELVARGFHVPMGSGVVVHRQRLLDLIDRLRVAMPADIRAAREVLQRQEEVLAEAQEEAARIIARAQAEMEERLKREAVVKAAEERAQEIVREGEERAQALVRDAETQARERLDEAQKSAQQQMEEADLYALQTMRRLETQLSNFLSTIRKGIEGMEERGR